MADDNQLTTLQPKESKKQGSTRPYPPGAVGYFEQDDVEILYPNKAQTAVPQAFDKAFSDDSSSLDPDKQLEQTNSQVASILPASGSITFTDISTAQRLETKISNSFYQNSVSDPIDYLQPDKIEVKEDNKFFPQASQELTTQDILPEVFNKILNGPITYEVASNVSNITMDSDKFSSSSQISADTSEQLEAVRESIKGSSEKIEQILQRLEELKNAAETDQFQNPENVRKEDNWIVVKNDESRHANKPTASTSDENFDVKNSNFAVKFLYALGLKTFDLIGGTAKIFKSVDLKEPAKAFSELGVIIIKGNQHDKKAQNSRDQDDEAKKKQTQKLQAQRFNESLAADQQKIDAQQETAERVRVSGSPTLTDEDIKLLGGTINTSASKKIFDNYSSWTKIWMNRNEQLHKAQKAENSANALANTGSKKEGPNFNVDLDKAAEGGNNLSASSGHGVG